MTKDTLTKYCRDYLETEELINQLKAKKEKLKEKIILELNEENQPSKYDITIKNIAPTTVFDSARFRKENSDMYNEYRTKEKAGYVTLSVVKM